MKIIKAQSLVLVCNVFSEDDISKRIHWYFNYHQIIPHSRFYNESTILIDTPQNQDTVCQSFEGQDYKSSFVLIG
jgi:hypothetical protein